MVYRLRFSKYGFIKFIGHLDVMRYLQKAVRRSGLPIKYSQGFTPHQIMSFALPLGLGITSDGEYMEMELEDTELTESEIFNTLQACITEGFELQDIVTLPVLPENTHQDKSMALVTAASYLVSVKDGYGDCLGISKEQELWSRFSDFMSCAVISVNKKTKKSEKEVNLKDYIYEAAPDAVRLTAQDRIIKNVRYELVPRTARRVQNAMSIAVPEHEAAALASLIDPAEHADIYTPGLTLAFTLAAGSVVNIKPELVMEAFCSFLGLEYREEAFQFHRLDLYMADPADEKGSRMISMDNA